MALPVTITGISTAVLTAGPFKSSGGNFYFFGRDNTTATTLQAYKATDPTSSWSSIATNTGFTTAVQFIAGVQDSDVIHLAVIDGSGSSVNLKYRTFNMATDAFVTSETVQSAFDPRDSTPTNIYLCSIIFRSSDSQPIILYNGARAAVMGTSYARIVYSRRTGVATWSAPTAVDAGGAFNFSSPEAILGSSSRTHFFWSNGSFLQRALNSSNVLQTASAATGSAVLNSPLQAVSYDDAGTQRVACSSDSGGGGLVTEIYFNSADAPTINSNGSVASGSASRLYYDVTDIWVLYLKADGVYVKKSTDDGATYGSEILAYSVTTSNTPSIDGNIYLRSTSYVIPYLISDLGTLKYNEYEVRSSVTTPWADMSGSSMLIPVKHHIREVVGY